MTVVWPTPSVLIACYVSFIIAIISIFTTSLAIVSYFCSVTIKSAYQNLLLLSLLINAIILSVNVIVLSGHGIVMGNSDILDIQWVCYLTAFLNTFCCGMEIYTLMCIALERYYAIKKQQPLTLKQIIGLLVFGYIWVGFITRYEANDSNLSMPYWNSSLYFTLSDAKFYCVFPYSDRSQIITTMTSVIHISICISVICYCYIGIYRIYRHLRKSRHATANKKDSYLQSHLFKEDSLRKDEEKEYRVLLTTVVLIGWTMIGWTPMLLMITYQIITGNVVNPYWEMVSYIFLTLVICGDSIILLVYDKRWKASIHEMVKMFRT